jgi:hypothetical protein
MVPTVSLLAWVKPLGPDEFVGAFVGEGATPDIGTGYRGRQPAIRLCRSPKAAQEWVEDQAAALEVPIKWINEAPPWCDPT